MKRLSTWKPATVLVICTCLAFVIALGIVAMSDASDAPAAPQSNPSSSSSLGILPTLMLIIAGGIIVFIAFVVSMLSNYGGKEETVPDWHVALIFKNRRFLRQTTGPTFHVRSEDGETFIFYDLREQSLPVEHKCDTADQISLGIKIDVKWQFTHKDDIHQRFLKESKDSEAALAKTAKSIVSKQIAMRDYRRALEDLKSIEVVLKADLPSKVLKYGIQINDVGLSEPQSSEAASQLVTASRVEAKHINIIDKAATKASDKTMDYLKMKEGRGKDKE